MALLSDIVRCELKPGTHIHEAKAAAAYKTSRTGLREAFIDLSAKGFIHLQKNKGATVALLDAATVYSVFEGRIVAEKAAAAMAASRASPDELTALEQFKGELKAAQKADDLDAYFAVDRAVHDSIAALSRNTFIEAQVLNLRAHTARCWHFYKDRGLEEHADYDELNAVISNVVERRPDRAAEAMRKHLMAYLDQFQNMLARQSEVLKWV